MGLLSRLLGREPDAQARGENAAARLEALAQLDPISSTEDRGRGGSWRRGSPRRSGGGSKASCASTACTSASTR